MCFIDPGTIVTASPQLEKWLADPQSKDRLAGQTLPQSLRQKLSKKIVFEGNLVLFENTYTHEALTAWKNVGLPSDQIESLCSHTHIEDWVKGGRDALFLQGLAFTLNLRDRLAPHGKFLIYLILSQNKTGETACTVQYHKKRSAEVLWGENPNWDILILEIGDPDKST